MSPFDRFAAALDPAMVVVTAVAGERRGGCLVGFHGQSSIDPPRYTVRLSKANHTCRVALLADLLTVHALDRADIALAELFGGSTSDEVDKFARCEWTAGHGGATVLLARCPNRVVLRVLSRVDDGGDHVAFVGEVADAASAGDLVPLRLSDAAHIDAGHPA